MIYSFLFPEAFQHRTMEARWKAPYFHDEDGKSWMLCWWQYLTVVSKHILKHYIFYLLPLWIFASIADYLTHHPRVFCIGIVMATRMHRWESSLNLLILNWYVFHYFQNYDEPYRTNSSKCPNIEQSMQVVGCHKKTKMLRIFSSLHRIG